MLFAAPPEQTLEWNDTGVEGALRFLKRLWKLAAVQVDRGPAPALEVDELTGPQQDLRRKLHQTLAKVSDDLERRFTFNTAIAAVMELLNDLARFEDDSAQGHAVTAEVMDAAILMLAPMIPHVCHVIWRELGHDQPVIDYPWPQVDQDALYQQQVELVVQVNGKLRSRIPVDVDADEVSCRAAASSDENVMRHLEGKTLRKVILVPGKLLNLVVS